MCFSTKSIAKALSLSRDIVFRRNALIRLSVEKHLSDSAVVIGVVIRTRRSFSVSVSTSFKLFLFINVKNVVAPPHAQKSGLP